MCKMNIRYEPDLVIAWLQLGGVQSHHFWMKFTIVQTSQLTYEALPYRTNFDLHDLTNSYLPKFFFLHI